MPDWPFFGTAYLKTQRTNYIEQGCVIIRTNSGHLATEIYFSAWLSEKLCVNLVSKLVFTH